MRIAFVATAVVCFLAAVFGIASNIALLQIIGFGGLVFILGMLVVLSTKG